MLTSQMRSALRRRVWQLLSHAGVWCTPVSDKQLERVAQVQGASVIESPSLNSLHGCLSATHEGLVIRVNPRLNPAERRYTIAHEIGHTLIDRDIPFTRNGLVHKIRMALDVSPSERERICDSIAAELLIPAPALAAHQKLAADPARLTEDIMVEFRTPQDAFFAHLNGNSLHQLQFAW